MLTPHIVAKPRDPLATFGSRVYTRERSLPKSRSNTVLDAALILRGLTDCRSWDFE